MKKRRRCSRCGQRLSVYNHKDQCYCHDFPSDYDPVGAEIKERALVLKRTGILPKPRPTFSLVPPLVSTIKLQKITYEGIPYEFLTVEI